MDPDLLDTVVGLFVHYSTLSADPEDPHMAVDLSRYYAWKEQQRAEGRAEGEARGRLIGLLEGRLDRALTDSERAQLQPRIARDGVDALLARVRELPREDLERWARDGFSLGS